MGVDRQPYLRPSHHRATGRPLRRWVQTLLTQAGANAFAGGTPSNAVVAINNNPLCPFHGVEHDNT